MTHTVVRLAFDQTVENLTGVGAPPATWPRSERAVDVAHKAIYSMVTGAVADRLVGPSLHASTSPSSGPGRHQHQKLPIGCPLQAERDRSSA